MSFYEQFTLVLNGIGEDACVCTHDTDSGGLVTNYSE